MTREYPHLDAVLSDVQLHDGADFLCRRYHLDKKPCPCVDCIRAMMTLNEALSGISFTDREAILAEVIVVRDIVEARRERARQKPAEG